ncbi:hypothetical protein BDP55DRAFT_760405 [Colletotrichum godetiae]|uniref:Uncharacterized protein n=1 Tax=Colletotrichum godetiae TaxID=1209918 RepID=A0AAJ0EQW9_9PEZI|nr:uncharacterized protein BDP55DRAFT_760405 [Colletotrichum godetiae]KAK1657994.1 hypothetical protein BDP55DRAFT_760405 [Colletotrichum godetiae]
MSVVKEVALGIMAWTKTPRTQTYRKLNAESDAEALRCPGPYDKQSFSHRLQRTSPKALVKLVLPVLLFSGLLFAVSRTDITQYKPDSNRNALSSFPPVEKGGQRHLRIIVPADGPSPDLCKMLMSGIASGYPSSVIVNWGRDFQKSPGGFGSSHLGKIDGTLEFLDSITSEEAPDDERLGPDDLVLLVDAYDVWFQLPPSVLIRRYMAQNYAADERIRKDWEESRSWFPSDSKKSLVPRQSIIISTQKKCWPDASLGSDPHCDDLPQSTAREDMYGPHTDEDPKQMHDLRPRYVNSGSLMGPIFGEQEIWRTSKRQNHDEWVKLQADHPKKAAQEAEQNDFSVGLDYIQDLFTPTVFEEDDGLYIVSSDGSGLRQAAADRGIDPPRVAGIPEDMLGLRSPIQESDIDKTMGWQDLPLYTDFWSTSVPVLVHHNAHRNGLKGQRLRDWWKNNWFFPYLRILLELHSKHRESLGPLFRAPGRNGVEDLVYKPPAADARKRKPRIFKKQDLKDQGLEEADWNSLCKSEGHDEWWNEVLQDNEGPL